jgi:hypothetical protein
VKILSFVVFLIVLWYYIRNLWGGIFASNNGKWDEYYYALEEYYKEYNNIDVPWSYGTESGLRLGKWLHRQRQNYNEKSNTSISRDHIQLLNDFIDWSPKDTKILNQTITNLNVKNYYEVLLARFNHVLDDVNYEQMNTIIDADSQKEITSIFVKRTWI